MVYKPDLEARQLAWERARRLSPPETGRLNHDPRAAAMGDRSLDPTAILDDDDAIAQLEESYRRSAEGWPDPELAMQQFLKAATQCFNAMREPILAFGVALGESLSKLSAIVGPLIEAVEPAPTQRRRHGRAAECPRHGPTKGGLCRSCARGFRVR